MNYAAKILLKKAAQISIIINKNKHMRFFAIAILALSAQAIRLSCTQEDSGEGPEGREGGCKPKKDGEKPEGEKPAKEL